MKMYRLFTAILVIALFSGFGCAGNAIDPRTGGAGENKPSLLVVYRKSDFKQQIVKKLKKEYEGRTRLFVADIDDLDKVREDDFDGMVVMGARMGWLLFSAKERHFLDNLKKPEKLVMVMTAAIRDWHWDRKDVDVISGASKTENVEPFYDEIQRRLDNILAHSGRNHGATNTTD